MTVNKIKFLETKKEQKKLKRILKQNYVLNRVDFTLNSNFI